MKRLGVLTLGIVVMLLLSVVLACASVDKISNGLQVREGNQKIRVVVHLKESSNLNQKGIFSSSGPIISSERINYKDKNNIFVSLTKQEIEQLAKAENVESVAEEKRYQILLQDSVPQINATNSWSLQVSSLNLTGSGQTICIIDTGVNYSHLDLGGCFGNNNENSSCKIIGGWDYCADDFDCTSEDNNPMDVEGHGTHVAGIAAANGSIFGVSPSSKIIMIKAGNATGAFWDSELKKSIDWCVNNASKFNISVISMSLGGGLYGSYCDEYSDGDNNPPGEGDWIDLVSSINAAIAKNISVIAASGNDNSPAYIASPACIQNVTPVGNIQKDDTFYVGFSRNFMVKLLAPGVNINSTIISGEYSGDSWTGTSMSTPHVAGAITIIHQFLKARGRTMTPSQIEDLLFNTGKKIAEPLNASQNFSRIDVYSALLSLDDISPTVELISPADNLADTTANQTFICNASDWQLENLTLNVWNSSELYYNGTESISGKTNQSEFNLTGMPAGDYFWNCFASDEIGNSNFYESNFSLTIGGINLDLSSPENNTNTNISERNFICNATSSNDRELKNLSFFIFENGILLENSSVNISGTVNSSTFLYNLTNEGNYTWGCETYSNESDYSAKNYTMSYEKTETIIAAETIVPRTSGGGSGGGVTPVITLSDQQLSLGVSKKISVGQRTNIQINNQNHSIQLNKIFNDSINLTIRSEPISFVMSMGEERKLNLTSAEYYDLYIKVESVAKSSVNITFRKIAEVISPQGIVNYNNQTNSTDKGKRYDILTSEKDTSGLNKSAILGGLIVFLGVGLILFSFLRKYKKKRPKKKYPLRRTKK